jgi:26S proteasome regulatory subunit N3
LQYNLTLQSHTATLVQLFKLTAAMVPYLRKLNRRTLDVLAARIVFYFALAHEHAGSLQSIRPMLLEMHCTAVLNHDDFGQETLLNLLLRNYLHYNLYDQAEKLRAQTQWPEGARSNQQYCRYLYYLGRIRAVKLEYTEAKECLVQAARKVCAL